MAYKVKANVPALGDNPDAGTLFPVDRPMNDRVYIEYLKESHPEQYERLWPMRRQILRATGAKHMQELEDRSYDKGFVEKVNRRMLSTRGFIEGALAEENPKEGFKNRLQGIMGGVRDHASYALSHVPVLGERHLQAKKRKMEDYGRRINKLINSLAQKFFPGYTRDLGWRNDTMVTNNPGKLFLMACDSSRANKVRYEAKRKLELMRHANRVDSALEERKRHLEFLVELMDERVYDPNGEKRGGTKTQWLVSTHNLEDDNHCIDHEFLEEPPAHLEENQFIEPIDLRTIEMTVPSGKRRKIDFMFDVNEKGDEAAWLKSLRHPERDINELLRDLNRGRFLFKNEEEMELVIEEMKRRIENPDVHGMKKHQVSIEKKKGGVGGDKGSPAIPCVKFNWVIDGRDYEFQAFLPKDYVDYFLWKRYAWCKHEVNRFFDNSLSETLWPEAHFPGLDRKRMAEEAFEREYRKTLESRKILPTRFPQADRPTPQSAPFSPLVLPEDADQKEGVPPQPLN